MFANFAHAAFDEFGSEVPYWFTFNEPIVEPQQRYTAGCCTPSSVTSRRARCSTTSRSHTPLPSERFARAKAAGVMRPDARIGLINCFTPPYTRENPSAADLEAVRMADGIDNRWWLDLVIRSLPADVLETLEKSSSCPAVRATTRSSPGDRRLDRVQLLPS